MMTRQSVRCKKQESIVRGIQSVLVSWLSNPQAKSGVRKCAQRTLALCALLATLLFTSQAQNLVQNGSFETPIGDNRWGWNPATWFAGQTFGGWMVEFGSIDIKRTPVADLAPAYDGVQWVDMNGTPGRGAIYQDIMVPMDGFYLLKFAINGNYYPSSMRDYRTMRVQVLRGSTVVFSGDFTHTYNPNFRYDQQPWEVKKVRLYLTADTYRLRFESLEYRDAGTGGLYYGPGVDAVSLVRFQVEGDVNGDGCVDDADLLAVLFAFGSSGTGLLEDVNGDGVVDDADLLMVLFNFGSGC